MLRESWRLLVVALVLACLLVWVVERIVVARGLQQIQEKVNREAAHLADGNKKSMILGSVLMLGTFDPIIRATALGKMPPNNPLVIDALKRLLDGYHLGNIRVINSKGILVAYYTQAGPGQTGRSIGFRPYFRAAVEGTPNMYAALGSHSGERGFYIAAPVYAEDTDMNLPSLGMGAAPGAGGVAAPGIAGVVVAKPGFEEVDKLLEQESYPLVVLSPEGAVFASNVKDWQFRVMGDQAALDAARRDSRTSEAFEKVAPRALPVDAQGRIEEGGHALQMVSAVIDWKDPQGAWRLAGFADPTSSFGAAERLAVGLMGFVFVVLLGSWWQARRGVADRTAQLEEANRQLAALSLTDGLTGLANRRHFDQLFAEEWFRARRSGLPMALLMADVDHFKNFNDRYGHQAGDECLKSVARVLQTSAQRAGDLAARYGGEEFALILPGTDAAAAQRLAESVRAAIEALAIPHESSPAGMVTVSIGVAAMAADTGQIGEHLLHSADKALYQAKHDGRNRVVTSDEEVAEG